MAPVYCSLVFFEIHPFFPAPLSKNDSRRLLANVRVGRWPVRIDVFGTSVARNEVSKKKRKKSDSSIRPRRRVYRTMFKESCKTSTGEMPFRNRRPRYSVAPVRIHPSRTIQKAKTPSVYFALHKLSVLTFCFVSVFSFSRNAITRSAVKRQKEIIPL